MCAACIRADTAAAQAKLAAGMPRKQLVGFGTAFGKFTKSKQFRLHVTCLDFVAQHAQHAGVVRRRPFSSARELDSRASPGRAWWPDGSRWPDILRGRGWIPNPTRREFTRREFVRASEPPPKAQAQAQAQAQSRLRRPRPRPRPWLGPGPGPRARCDSRPTAFGHPSRHKVWLKPSAEQSFLYGNHVRV